MDTARWTQNTASLTLNTAHWTLNTEHWMLETVSKASRNLPKNSSMIKICNLKKELQGQLRKNMDISKMFPDKT